MKTVIQVFIFLFLFGSSTIAQPTSGTVFVGGDIGLSVGSNKSKNDNTTTTNYNKIDYSLLPQLGYFVSDIIAVGARIGISGDRYKYEDNFAYDKVSSSYFVFNPFARYYIINQKGGLFAEADMNLGFGKTKTTYTNIIDEDNSTNIFMGLKPGVYYYISDRIVLQAFYGWFGFRSNIDKEDNDNKDISNTFGFDLSSNSFAFGFAYEF